MSSELRAALEMIASMKSMSVSDLQYMAKKALATAEQTEGAIPAGMKPWHGGDSAPEDWDRGPVKFRQGAISPIATHPDFRAWIHDGRSYDIIAYTPKPHPDSGKQSGEGNEAIRLLHALMDNLHIVGGFPAVEAIQGALLDVAYREAEQFLENGFVDGLAAAPHPLGQEGGWKEALREKHRNLQRLGQEGVE